MNELEKFYRVLGLEPGASLEEINQAYKDLAFIWHPDRIPKDNQRLLEKAAAKLKEINHAREQLRLIRIREQRSHYSRVSSPPTPPPTPRETVKQSYSQSYHSYQSYYQSYQAQTKRPYDSDLSGADLKGANLQEKDLSGRNLSGADLREANLTDAFLHKINLEGAILIRANLFRANLLQANLRNANLQEANLIGADFSGADLRGANLQGAKIGSGDRIMVKLTGALLIGTILPDGRIHS